MAEHKVIFFYRYVEIEEPENLVKALREFCVQHSLLGRILVAKEGINGAVCGKEEDIFLFKAHLNEIFHGVGFREQDAS